MRNLTKKIMIYLMVGMMQVGIGTAVVVASPLYNDGTQRIVQLDDRQDHHDQRQREENRRHEQEMRRHDGENDRDWNDRQWRENQQHEQIMQDIERELQG
jgi:hypothetical protein